MRQSGSAYTTGPGCTIVIYLNCFAGECGGTASVTPVGEGVDDSRETHAVRFRQTLRSARLPWALRVARHVPGSRGHGPETLVHVGSFTTYHQLARFTLGVK